MTKNEIIEQWYREGVVQDVVRNIVGDSADPKYDDLVSIVYLALLEKPDELIQHLYTTGSYKYYISRVVKIQVKYPNSTFQWCVLRHSQKSTQIDATVMQIAEKQSSEAWEAAMEYINLLKERDREPIELYLKFGTQTEAAKAAGISQSSFGDQLNRVIKEIKYYRECDEAALAGAPPPKRKKQKRQWRISREEIRRIYQEGYHKWKNEKGV